MRVRVLVPMLVVGIVVSACGGSSSPGASPAAAPSGVGSETSTSVDRQPSPQAAMICDPEGVEDITAALQVQTASPPKPGWDGFDYTCTYSYEAGAQIVLKVRDLPNTAAAATYFAGLGRTLGRVDKKVTFGTDGAFATADGSVAVQKDSHVLIVDVAGLPEVWSKPPLPRSDAAGIVASAVMGCWEGDG